jgi:PII-like signaling protein
MPAVAASSIAVFPVILVFWPRSPSSRRAQPEVAMPEDGPVTRPAVRLMVFLTEDDAYGHRIAAEELLDRARVSGLAGATVWRALEGFGRGGHLRAARLPDLARGLPLVFEVIDDEEAVSRFVEEAVSEVAPGTLVTLEPVQVSSPPPLAEA